jgi:hypothetical protein
MAKTLIFMLTLLIFPGGDLSKSLSRKIDKALSRSFVSDNISRNQLYPGGLPLGRPDPGLKLYALKAEEDFVGYLIVTTAKGRYDYFDYMVIYEPDLSIRQVSILVYRSDHGDEIASKKWLAQFVGKDGCGLALGLQVDAISGATYSATSITEDIQILCDLMRSLGESGFLP